MSDHRIIYHDANEDRLVVVIPFDGWLAEEGNTLQKLANKTIPVGTKYKIVDVSYIPSDRTFRNAWEEDFTTYDGISEGEGV